MKAHTEAWGKHRATFAAVGVMALALSAISPFAQPAAARNTSFADPAFEKVWARSDKPVDERMAARS